MKSIHRIGRAALAFACVAFLGAMPAQGSDFAEPWKRADRALVVDAYEYNPIDWHKLVGDKRIVGFINKGSDGLSPPYRCSGNETQIRLCKALWKRHAVARELFQTRRTVAKALGLKWGAYHLGRPDNPIDQANNFIDFANPAPDDLIAIDIEENDPKKWMSLEDAEIFARHIHTRLGRWPVLYTNGNTALYIAENRDRYSLLSRLPLWYARYKPAIGLHFPKGHWNTYTLWQFAAAANCSTRSCPYRVPGTPLDIDVNVASMSAEALREAWPFGGLIEKKDSIDVETAETVPLPVERQLALDGGDVTLQFAKVEHGDTSQEAAQEQLVEQTAAEEIVELTGESVPLPIWRSEARKKRGDVTLKFVAVERVVLPDSAAPAILAAASQGSPFRALLGNQDEPSAPVLLASYAQTPEEAPRLPAPDVLSLPPHYVPTGEMSTAALDDPKPILLSTQLSRKELPVFLLRKLDGPDGPQP